MTDISAYSQLSFRPVEPLAVVLGVRVLHSLTYGLVPLYKGGLRWEIGHGLYAHTRIARNFRQPTLRELYLPYPTANPDLRPETSLNWDFGLGYESEHFELSCVGYRTAADDLIRYFGVWPAAEVVNIDHIAIWGVEGRLAARHLGPVTLTVTGDWQDVGRYTRQNPDAKLDFTLEAGHQFAAHSIAGSLTGEWVHGLYMSNYGRDPLADVFSMDLALRYRYSAPGWALEPYLFLRNFLDRRYAYVEGYPMPGFNLLAGLKLEL